MAITEHYIREELGPGQLSGRHAWSIMAAQRVRQEALATLLPAVWDDPTARQAVIEVCKDHPDASLQEALVALRSASLTGKAVA